MTPPRTETERKLGEIWKELLKVEEVGVDQNFFELGGHSLLVLQVIARIRRMFEVELAVGRCSRSRRWQDWRRRWRRRTRKG